MAAAIMGLIGVTFGAIAALFGSAWSDRRHARKEEACYRRDQRNAAYEGALRYLNRAAKRRSELLFGATGSRALLSGEHVRDWFDDLTEAQYWVRILVSRCGPAQVPRMRQVMHALDAAARDLDRGTSPEVRRPTRTPGPASSRLLLADPASSRLLLADPASSRLLLADPASSRLLLADPVSSGRLLADPVSSGRLLADPASSGLLSDPASSPLLWDRIVPCAVIEPTNPAGLEPIIRIIQAALETITDCARLEMGREPDTGAHTQAELMARSKLRARIWSE